MVFLKSLLQKKRKYVYFFLTYYTYGKYGKIRIETGVRRKANWTGEIVSYTTSSKEGHTGLAP